MAVSNGTATGRAADEEQSDHSRAETREASAESPSRSATPPATLSLSGDMLAAAVRAAEQAGVEPANPDTPGPQDGLTCPGFSKYSSETTTGLRSDVATAWRTAATSAAAHDITLCLNDGKRSMSQQQRQFDEYVAQYGRAVAEHLALPPDHSQHVVGLAVDVQPAAGYRWLESTEGSLGFCRIYRNEPWHFEFNPAYRKTGCPALIAEPG